MWGLGVTNDAVLVVDPRFLYLCWRCSRGWIEEGRQAIGVDRRMVQKQQKFFNVGLQS